jgi:membrane protease YdiL (CAAX protease family)
MNGMLKEKSPWTQFLLFICITLVSFFVIGIIGGLIVAAVSHMSMSQLADISKLDFSQPGAIDFLREMQLVQFFALFLVPVLISAWLFSTDRKKYLGWQKPYAPMYLMVGVVIMIVAIPATGILGDWNHQIPFPKRVENWIRESEENAARMVQALLSKHTIKDLVLNVLCIAGLAAIGEELLFRSMAQRLLIKMFKSAWAGIIIAAALFSAMHMEFYGFIPRFALGILLGAIYWYSGSIWTAMLAHFIYDGVVIVIAYFNPSTVESSPVPESALALWGAIGTVGVIFLLIWMKRKSPANYNTVYAGENVPVKDHPF